ncbi:MAG: hypothetical protein C0465_25720 [Ralstonia sp.]|jgi:hypothetical protein|uniref:hypothetical protein n=1 Tax=Ralstonia sp. TaxID=54061 RepID=UPI00257CA44C|nr:hypothetical protein [Ralstonia sp.]MBA4233975.1 hypothetical protein [Ralstonia sp.]
MDKISSTLTNLTGFSFIARETAIHRELAPLLVDMYLPDINNNIVDPRLPVDLVLPSRRTYGRLSGYNGRAWLVRYDQGYVVVCSAPIRQKRIDALLALTDDAICFATAEQDGKPGPLMIKFEEHNHLVLLDMVLREALSE